jgi:hypothetical protein
MDNVQNCDSYINIPSSQTYRQHFYPSIIIRWDASGFVHVGSERRGADGREHKLSNEEAPRYTKYI